MSGKWRMSGKNCLVLLLEVLAVSAAAAQSNRQRISLDDAIVLVNSSEPSYIQYAAKDLGNYLAEISGRPIRASASASVGEKAKSVLVVGKTMAQAWRLDLPLPADLADEGSVIRSFDQGGTGSSPSQGPTRTAPMPGSQPSCR